MTADDIAQKIASRNGLTTGTIDSAGAASPHVFQQQRDRLGVPVAAGPPHRLRGGVSDQTLNFRRAAPRRLPGRAAVRGHAAGLPPARHRRPAGRYRLREGLGPVVGAGDPVQRRSAEPARHVDRRHPFGRGIRPRRRDGPDRRPAGAPAGRGRRARPERGCAPGKRLRGGGGNVRRRSPGARRRDDPGRGSRHPLGRHLHHHRPAPICCAGNRATTPSSSSPAGPRGTCST